MELGKLQEGNTCQTDPQRLEESNEKIPMGLNFMCSDNEEIHLDVELQGIQVIKKGGISGFCELGFTVSSVCHDTLDNIIVLQRVLHTAHIMKRVSEMQALVGREESASWQAWMFLAFPKEPLQQFK